MSRTASDPTIERCDVSASSDLPVDLIFCGKSNARTGRLDLVSSRSATLTHG